ncbi:acyltransferase [bacterium]|nr:acyltransferase [bacterium]
MGIINKAGKPFRKLKSFCLTLGAKSRLGAYGKGLRVNHKCRFSKHTYIGNNCHFNGISIEGGGKVTIRDNFHSGHSIILITQNHNYEGDELPYDSKYTLKDIIIEENVWLGSRVIILGGVTIGEGAIIQAGSVVVNDIPPLGIAGGHPAKVFRSRDKDHYQKLKFQKKFH